LTRKIHLNIFQAGIGAAKALRQYLCRWLANPETRMLLFLTIGNNINTNPAFERF